MQIKVDKLWYKKLIFYTSYRHCINHDKSSDGNDVKEQGDCIIRVWCSSIHVLSYSPPLNAPHLSLLNDVVTVLLEYDVESSSMPICQGHTYTHAHTHTTQTHTLHTTHTCKQMHAHTY